MNQIISNELNFRKVFPSIGAKLPEFIRIDHPGFIAFMEAYFEWLESEYSSFSPYDLKYVKDVDKSFDVFIDHFRKEFLLNFPKELATNPITGPLDQRKLIKNIKDFYRDKGTEKSFNLLFRILFDTDVEIYLPKTDILRASDGKWQRQKSIKTTVNLGNDIFLAKNQRIEQIDLETNRIKAYGRVERVVLFHEGEYEVAELFLADIEGTFKPNYAIRFSADGFDKMFLEPHTFEVVTDITISNRGKGHIVGEYIGITNGGGVNAYAVVNRVDQNGGVLQARMVNFGANYTSGASVGVVFTRSQTEIDTGISTAAGFATTGALCNYSGIYSNEDGQLSSGKVLQDNRYYQNFSYVLKSEIVISRYRDTIKSLIHPAGFAFFGAVHIKRCSESDISQAHSLLSFEVPIIGHYTPYTLDETNDLSITYPNGYNSPLAGTTLASPGSPNSYPFWIIYSHPNTRGIDNIPEGTRFGDVVIDDFFHMPSGQPGSTCGVTP